MLGVSEGDLRNMKSLADRFPLSVRTDKLSWRHHYEVASIKELSRDDDGKLHLSDATDYEKIAELLAQAEKEKLSVRELRDAVRRHKEWQQGATLAGMEKHNGDPRSRDVTRLSDLGISKMQSHRWAAGGAGGGAPWKMNTPLEYL